MSDMVPDMSVPQDEAPEEYEESFPGQMKFGEAGYTPQGF